MRDYLAMTEMEVDCLPMDEFILAHNQIREYRIKYFLEQGILTEEDIRVYREQYL